MGVGEAAAWAERAASPRSSGSSSSLRISRRRSANSWAARRSLSRSGSIPGWNRDGNRLDRSASHVTLLAASGRPGGCLRAAATRRGAREAATAGGSIAPTPRSALSSGPNSEGRSASSIAACSPSSALANRHGLGVAFRRTRMIEGRSRLKSNDGAVLEQDHRAVELLENGPSLQWAFPA